MKEFSVKSNFWQRIREAKRILSEEGLINVFRAVFSNLVFHLSSKWRFVYFVLSLDEQSFSLKTNEGITVTIAVPQDMERVQSEIFPALNSEMEYEKRYFKFIGENEIKCFLVELDGIFVHYSWVFLDATRSLLADVPFDQNYLTSNDAFIGPVFTNPTARGLIYFHALSAIFDFLKNETSTRRVIVFVDGRNTASLSFYKRLGFEEIVGAQPKGIFSFMWRGLSRSKN